MRLAAFTALLALALSSGDARAQTWTDWQSADTDGVSGELVFGLALGVVDVFYESGYEASRTYTGDPATPWSWDYGIYDVDGVGTRPTLTDQVGFNRATSGRFLFSRPVVDPFIAIMSQGRSGLPVRYSFSDPFTVISEGRGYWGDGTYATDMGCGPDGACAMASTEITGREFHGMIRFSGTFTEIGFTSPDDEFWHSMTLGAEDVVVTPEPLSGLLLASGLLGLGGVALRRRNGEEG